MTPAAFRPRLPRWVAPAGAVLLAASALGATLYVQRASVAPASPVPAATLGTAPPAKELASSAPAVAAIAPAPSAALGSDEPREGTRPMDGPAEARKSRGRNAAHSSASKARIVTVPAGSVPSSAQPTAASQDASAPSASAPPATNAWDRQTFGGRF